MDLAERPSTEFQRHPWELSRWTFFTRLLKRAGLFATTQRVLDVGSGDGWFLTELLREMPAGSSGVGWDLGYDAATYAALGLPRSDTLQFTSQEPDGRFSVLLMLDVLEHVADDAGFLAQRLDRNLAPGAHVLVSVPCWPLLYTSHDVALGHYRRYRPAALCRLLTEAGLSIEQSGGLFHALTVPRALAKLKEAVRPPRGAPRPTQLAWHGGPFVTGAVSWALAADNRVSVACARHGVRLPGLSFWALCKRRSPGSVRADPDERREA